MGSHEISFFAWRLRYELLSTHVLLKLAQAASGGGAPRPEVHLFLADRYERLAHYHRRRGAAGRARELAAKAEWHYHESGLDDPPRAAAMAMPRPRPHVFTDARGRPLRRPPDDAA